MLTPIEYDEYHKLYADHLMRDIDILPDFRIIEIECYNREVKWFKSSQLQFNIGELEQVVEPIKSILIT